MDYYSIKEIRLNLPISVTLHKYFQQIISEKDYFGRLKKKISVKIQRNKHQANKYVDQGETTFMKEVATYKVIGTKSIVNIFIEMEV